MMPSDRHPSDDEFPLPQYERNRGEILLNLSHYNLSYLNLIYQLFDGDLAMVIVLGEISHHNTSDHFNPHALENPRVREIQHERDDWRGLEGCNALSISHATGIPRETVRRKIAELKRRGWLADDGGKGLYLTAACVKHFTESSSRDQLRLFLRASRAIERLLQSPADSGDSGSESPEARRSPRKRKGGSRS
jgi:hypothetical protein